MHDQPPSFIEVPEPEDESSFHLISESAEEPAVQFYYAPETVEEFFRLDGLYQVLAKSLVFIHNRKDSSDYLVKIALEVADDSYSFRFFQTHTTKLQQILEEIAQPDDDSEAPEICIVDITSIAEELGEFCEAVVNMKGRTRGVWIRGYIRDISPRLVQLFGLLFAFDMSDSEFDVLRTTISLSSEQLQLLRDYGNRASNVDIVLTFINYERFRGAPMLAYNPIALSQVRGYTGLMDITPFVSTIVEATDFVFDEVGKWISDIRQRASQESGLPFGAALPVTRERFTAARSDSKLVAELLNQAITLADINEIRNLLDQLKTRRALFLELESQEVTAAGAEAAKLRVQMQSAARDIIKTAERLESALSRVYRS
jgi:hypothetical protein